MQGITWKVYESLNIANEKKLGEKTSFEIRIYDDRTGAACYVNLNKYELKAIIGLLGDAMVWR